MPDGEPSLRVTVSDERGRAVRASGLAAWLARVAPARARGSVSVALVSDARVRALNRSYRRKDCATDVLSFPAFARQQDARASARQAATLAREKKTRASAWQAPPSPQSLAPSPFLGDIVIARGVARRQAREARHSEQTELKVLALHGLLHLLGYDHERDGGRMQRTERRLRRKGGLREGLIERAHVHTSARPELVEGRARR
jgi:probable rRNA maturation factor